MRPPARLAQGTYDRPLPGKRRATGARIASCSSWPAADEPAQDLFSLARDTIRLDVWSPVHADAALERAWRWGWTLIGINHRDLHSFATTRRVTRGRAEDPRRCPVVATKRLSTRRPGQMAGDRSPHLPARRELMRKDRSGGGEEGLVGAGYELHAGQAHPSRARGAARWSLGSRKEKRPLERPPRGHRRALARSLRSGARRPRPGDVLATRAPRAQGRRRRPN